MKYIFPAIKTSTILLCLLVFTPCFAERFSSGFFSDINQRFVFTESDISTIIRDFTVFNNPNVISDFIPYNISNEIELFSSVSTQGKAMSNVSSTEKADTAPDCRKYKCQQGLTDQEWEKGIHIFILCFFVIPFLSTLVGVIAGVKGWIKFN